MKGIDIKDKVMKNAKLCNIMELLVLKILTVCFQLCGFADP